MTDRELMQQALDALEYASDETKPEGLHGCECLICKAIPALLHRLVQTEQELMIDCPRCGHCCPQPNQEPVAWRTFDGEGGYDYRNYEDNEEYAKEWEQRNPKYKGWVEPLYATPLPSTWFGLTDEDRQALAAEQHSWEGLCSAVEARLKEKNT